MITTPVWGTAAPPDSSHPSKATQPESEEGTPVTIRAAIYTRVSTRENGKERENRRQELRRYAESQGWRVVDEYQDQDSGFHASRAGLQSMLRDASRRRFDVLLFWSLDGLTREGALATLKYLNRLSSYGVGFRSFTDPYLDSCGIFKEVVIAILGAIAQQERVRRSERVRAGLERARRHGTRSGRPVGRPRAVVDRAEAVRLRTEGWSWGRIARRLGISVAAARRAWESREGVSQLCQKPQDELWQGNVERSGT